MNLLVCLMIFQFIFYLILYFFLYWQFKSIENELLQEISLLKIAKPSQVVMDVIPTTSSDYFYYFVLISVVSFGVGCLLANFFNSSNELEMATIEKLLNSGFTSQKNIAEMHYKALSEQIHVLDDFILTNRLKDHVEEISKSIQTECENPAIVALAENFVTTFGAHPPIAGL